ncbi:hypothetical protein LJB88_04110 [Erysipelotrichaceae bacterium OttesenSCG-928-M19]|nr:hypothetical protein [Erysipelotrichaceae bacterium OttesenSCG-928-M19]
MDYNIYHLFPQLLNLYGDKGNITTLCYFAKQFGLNPVVHEVNDVADIVWDDVDFMLLGGGSDREQAIVTAKLSEIKEQLKAKIEAGLPLLAVCGGYQFLGNYYQDSQGNKLAGLGILDFYTVGQTKERLLGNCVIETTDFGSLIGFVNHAGETFHDLEPLGQAIVGYGNNLESKAEGIRYKNLIGTYLHGPLLPRNPALTLFFIEKFLQKNNVAYDFMKIDLTLEEETRASYLNKIGVNQ